MTDDLTTLICVSDLHINSTVALCPPTAQLDDGQTVSRSDAQRWLWRNWLDFWSRAAQQPGRKIAVVNGDIAELDTKRRSVQLISANKATIIKTVGATMEPMTDVADEVIVIRGTPAHVGKGAWIEEVFADDLDNTIRSDTSASHYHARMNISGVRVDLAHHASMGRQPWTKNNAANALAARLLWHYKVELNKKPPHLAIRAHNHQAAVGYAMGGGDEVEVRYMPAWTLATEYTYRAGFESSLSDIGGLFVRIGGGSFEIEPVIYPYRITEAQLWKPI